MRRSPSGAWPEMVFDLFGALVPGDELLCGAAEVLLSLTTTQ